MCMKKCCCCLELHQGVKFLGITFILLTSLFMIGSVIFTFMIQREAYFGIIVALPSLVVNLLLVRACVKKKRILMLPW